MIYPFLLIFLLRFHFSFFDDNDKNFVDNLRRWRECRRDDLDIYAPLIETLKRYKFLFCPGEEKCNELRHILPLCRNAVFELRDFGFLCEAEKVHGEWGDECIVHTMYQKTHRCSKSRIRHLMDWCLDNIDDLNLMDSAVRRKTFDNRVTYSHSPRVLARHGFINIKDYLSEKTIMCVYCGLVMHAPNPEDAIVVQHAANSLECAAFKSV